MLTLLKRVSLCVEYFYLNVCYQNLHHLCALCLFILDLALMMLIDVRVCSHDVSVSASAGC